jgi:hypothetical protein
MHMSNLLSRGLVTFVVVLAKLADVLGHVEKGWPT